MTDFRYKTYRELQEDVANMQSSNTTITPEQVESLRRYRENIERDTSPIPSFYYMREGAEKSPLYYTNKPFGSSQYDPKNISLEDLTTMYENPNELRAMAQPWYDQLANGAAKAVLTAANTFVSGTAGLIWGLGSAVTHWDFARLWDNSVTNASQGFSDWMEENLANYKTKKEQETPFNFGSMNFWADTILKNVGFAVGAFYSGKLFTGGLGALAKGSSGLASKLGAGYNTQKAIMQGTQKVAPWVHAITSAVGEGSIEAINNSRDKFRLAKQQLDDQFHQMQQEVMEEYGDSPEGFAELEKLGKAYDESLKTLEQEKIAMGNMDLLWNIPILTFSNWIQFGKYIGRGFQTAKKNVKVKGDWGNYRAAMTNRKAKLKAATVGFSEGAEEWSQRVASDWAGFYTGDRATDNIISNFQNAGYNYQATVEHYGWMDSLAKSLSTNFVDPQAWEEFFVGALYGITGIPIIAKSKKGTGYRFQLAGGSYAEYKEAKKEQATQQYYADYMNRVAKKFAEEKASDQRTKNYWVNIIAHNALEKQKEAAALNDDAKGFKDAEFQEALRDIIMFDTTGNLNTLKEQIKEMTDMSDEEIANLIEATTDKKTAEQQRNEDKERLLILTEQKRTLHKHKKFIESQLLAIQDKINETYEEPQTKAVKKKRKNLTKQKEDLIKKYGIRNADAVITEANSIALDLGNENTNQEYSSLISENVENELADVNTEENDLYFKIKDNKYKDIVTGPFVKTNGGDKMTVEEARIALKQKLDNNATNIDLYIKANNELQLDLGPNLSQDEADLMIYLKAQQYNWAKRAKELFKEIHNTLNGLGGDTLLQEKAKIQNKMAELESAEKKKSKEYEDAKKALMFIDVAEQALTALLTEDKNEDDTLFKAAAFFTNPGLLEFIDKTSNKYLDDIAQVLNTRGIELPQKIADLKKIGKGIQEFSELYKKYKENPDKLSEDIRINREGTQAAAANKAANDLYKKLDFTDANTLTESLDNYKEAIERVGGIEKLIPFMSDPEKSLFNSLGIRGTLGRGLANLLNKTDIDPDIASAIVDKAISEITTEALSEKKLRDILNGAITVDSIDEILQDSIVDDLERRNTAEALARDAADALSKQEGTNDFDLAIDILHNALNNADATEAAQRSRDERIKEEAKEEGKEAGAKADEMEKKAAEESKAMAEEAAVTRKEEVEPKEPEGSPQEEPKNEPKDTPQEEPKAPTTPTTPVQEDPIDKLHEEMSKDKDTSTTNEDIDDFADNVTPPQSSSSNKVFSYPNRLYVTEFPRTENKDFKDAYYYDLLEEALKNLKVKLESGNSFKEAFFKNFPKGLYNDSLDNLQNYRNAVIFTAYVKAVTSFLQKSKAYDYVNNGNLLQDIRSKGSKFILDYNEELQESLRTHIKDALEKENFNFSETNVPIVPVIARVNAAGGTQILGTYYSKMDYKVSGQKDSPAKKLYDEFLDRLRSNPSSKFNVGDIVKFDGTSIVIDKIDSDGNLIGHFTGDKHPVRVKKADFNRLTLFKAVKPQSTINNPIELEITESDLRFGRAIVGQVNIPISTTEGYEEDEDNLEVVVAQYNKDTKELLFLKQNSDGTVTSLTADDLNIFVSDRNIEERYKTGQQYLIVRSKNTSFGVPMLLTSTIVEKGSTVSKEVSLQVKEIVDTLIKEFAEAKDDNEKKDAISKSLSDIKKLLGNKDADIDIGRFENNGKSFIRDFDISNNANKIHLKLHEVGIQVKYSDIESVADKLIDALTRKGKRGFEGLTTTISLRRMNDPKYREEVFENTNSNLELTHMGNEWFTFKVKEDSKKDEPKTDPIEDTPVNPEPSSKPADPIAEDTTPDVRMDPEKPKPARANTKGNNRYSTETISNKKNKRRARETTKTLTTPTEKINLDEELSWIDKVLPQMSREGRVQLKKGLIKMQESGKDAWGMFDNGVITLSDMAATGTTYHEAFHAVFNMYLSDKVQEDLFRQARRRYGNIDNIALEEAMAEEFRLYIQDKLKTGFNNRLKSFFKDLGIIVNNWFRVRPSINKYFLDISRGKFANKTAVNSFTETRLREEEYTQEMRDILAKAPRDSQGRLLAPNGKVSNLTERQYAQVRTKAFKKWFGDWERVARSSRFRESQDIPNSITSATYQGVTVSEALFDPDMAPDGGKRIIALGDKYIGEIPVIETKDKIRMGGSIGAATEIEEEYRGKGYGKKAHLALANIAKAEGKTLYSDKSNSDAEDALWKSLVKDGIAEVVSEKPKVGHWNHTTYRILNDKLPQADDINSGDRNVSKVVDENGEPLVVYHGNRTDNKITAFDLSKKGTEHRERAISGFWFITDENIAKEIYALKPESIGKGIEHLKYGEVIPVFLNIKNPIKAEQQGIEVKDTLYGRFTTAKENLNDFIDRSKTLETKNTDGYILTMVDTDDRTDDYLSKQIQLVVFNPTQIKSATENIGTFDPNNPDIRYREAVDVNNEKQLKSDIESFLGNFGIKINELSEFDSEEPLFNALDRVVNYTNIENLTENAGYAVAFMMQHSSEIKDLIGLKRVLDSTTGVKGFKRALKKTGDYSLERFTDRDYTRLNRDRYLKEIGKDIAEQLRKLYSGEKINISTNIFKKIWDVITEFFNSITPEARGKFYIIKHHTQNIANSIKLGDYTIIRKSEFKPGTTTRAELVDIEEALRNNPYEERIVSILNKYGIALAGGASIASQGTLFRPSENPLHDLDFNAAEYTQKGIEDILQKNFKAFKKTNEIVNSPNAITYTYLVLNREFEERRDVPGISVMTIYDKNTGEKLGTRVGSELVIEKEGVEGKMLDFFTGSESRKHGENVTLNFNEKQYLFSNYKNAMAFKVDIAREKDIWDYNNFMPNETGVKTLSEIRDEKKGNVKDLINRAKIIWGHPAIGKTTYLENNQDILEWDQEVNEKRNRFVREQIDPSYSMDITSTEYKKLAQEYLREWSSHPEYVEFITTEWNNLKQRAFVEGKKLFASPLVLAQLFKEDFDLFVALPEKQFLERDIARGNYRGSSLGWKQAINDLLVEVDQDKLVYTTKYFSDFMRDTLGVSWGTLTENERSLLISEGWSKESFDNLPSSERDAMINKNSETIEKYSKFTASLNNKERAEPTLSKAQEEAIDKCEI